jgi:hypothetical protein
MKMEQKTRIIIFLLTLMVVSLTCLMLPIILNIKIDVFAYSLLGLIILGFISSYFAKKTGNNILQKISFIFSIPLSIIHLILSLGIPTGVLLFNIFILFAVSFGIPFLIMNQIETFFNFGLKKATMYFCCISFASILSVYLSKYLLKFILKVSPVTMDTYTERPKNKYLKELTSVFYQKNNIIFVIYTCYFVFLGIISFFKIQYEQPLLSPEIDMAILQSFLVFIAFTNMIIKSKDIKLAPQTILALYAKIILDEDIIRESTTTNKEDKVKKD